MGTRFGWHSGVANAKGITIGKSTLPQEVQTRGINSYTQSNNSGTDTRGAYIRHYLKVASDNGGEAVRAFTTLNAAIAGGAHGLHASLSAGTGGAISGLGVAARATLHVANAAGGSGTGTMAAIQAEIYGDGSSSTIAAATEVSFLRIVADGAHAAVKATIDTAGYLMSIQGLTVGSGKLFQENTAGAATHALKILVGATPYYIMLTDTGA
jgi:hypothetical protein